MQNDPSHLSENTNHLQLGATPSQQPERHQAPMPAWLRAEVGPDYQVPSTPAVQQHMSPVLPSMPVNNVTQEREIKQLRAEVNALRRQINETQQGLGGCLVVWLALQLVVITLVALPVLVDMILGVRVNGSIVLFFAFLIIISNIGLWNRQKWGYYVQVIGYVLDIAYSFITVTSIGFGSPLLAVIAPVIGLIVISALVYNRWKIFR